MIYTASFFEKNYWGKGRLVSIARSVPEKFKQNYDYVIRDLLAPTYSMSVGIKHGYMKVEGYQRAYYRLLSERYGDMWPYMIEGSLGEIRILDVLDFEDEDTLLCWEKYWYFCHRKIVAELLEKNGIKIRRK